MKKLLVLVLACLLAVSFSGLVFAADYKGKVTAVDGKMVTIKITKGKARDFSVGDKIKIETKDGAPKKGGGSMLQGC